MGRLLALIALLIIVAAVAACSGGAVDTGTSLNPTATAAVAPTAVPASATATQQPTPRDAAESTGMSINADTIAAGEQLFTGSGGCGACHTIPGVAHGVLGPDLTGIATVASGRISGYSAEAYLRESIVDSCAYTVPETDCNLMLSVMNTVHLSDEDVDALVAFLMQQR